MKYLIKKIIKIVDLTTENLKEIPEMEYPPYSCKYCLYWEFPKEHNKITFGAKRERLNKKLKWLNDVNKIFGNCGKLVYLNNKVVGYAVYAPPKFLPNSKSYPSGPPDDDAILIACLYVLKKEYRGLGIGQKLLRSILSELRDRHVKVVETFARKSNAENPSGPVDFYIKKGFKIYKDDPEFPLMKLKL